MQSICFASCFCIVWILWHIMLMPWFLQSKDGANRFDVGSILVLPEFFTTHMCFFPSPRHTNYFSWFCSSFLSPPSFFRATTYLKHSKFRSTTQAFQALLCLCVLFPRNAKKLHKQALLSQRSFWVLMLQPKVHFETLSDAISKLDSTIRSSDSIYRSVVRRHPNNVKLLRLWVMTQSLLLGLCMTILIGQLQHPQLYSSSNSLLGSFFLG